MTRTRRRRRTRRRSAPREPRRTSDPVSKTRDPAPQSGTETTRLLPVMPRSPGHRLPGSEDGPPDVLVEIGSPDDPAPGDADAPEEESSGRVAAPVGPAAAPAAPSLNARRSVRRISSFAVRRRRPASGTRPRSGRRWTARSRGASAGIEAAPGPAKGVPSPCRPAT